jgi:PKD repeat protein
MVNNEGNAEIMGVVLLIAIFVGAITLMGVMMLSAPQPEKVPAVAFDFWTDDSHTNISLVHRGGETLNLSGAQLKVVYSDGSSSENPSVGIDGGSAKSWSEVSASSTYGIGNSINFTTDRSVDQVQLVWPGIGGASMTGGGGPVLLGAWSSNGSSGKNPPAAVTGAVPITFPYPSEGPTRAQPTQTPPIPWVYFIANITATNGTLPINFTNLTENQGNYGLLWSFGDGGTSTDQSKSVIHSFPDPATLSSPYFKKYPVTLTLTNSSDGTNTSYSLSRPEYITVYMRPTAQFTPVPTEGNAPFNVSFIDSSTGYIDRWTWDFGDGETGHTPGTSWHIYKNAGDYSVNLTVANPFEPNSRDYQYIKVHQPLVPDFTESPNPGVATMPVLFTDLSTGDLIHNWFWDFGDGTTSNYQNATHTYATAGTYNVSLSITNPWGTNTTTRPFTVISAPLVANFTNTTSKIGNSELTVQFKDISTGNPTSWLWAFGDGTTSLEQNPSHTYTNPGTTPKTYNVTLTVNNTDEGSTITKTEFVTVYPPLVAAFDLVNWTYNAMDTVWFADQSKGYNIERWTWNFGDGTTSTFLYPGPTNVSHIYTAAGNYTVNLTIANPYGTNVSQPAVVRVLSPLVANFTANRTAGNAQLPIQFNDTSTGDGINGWSWDFGDNTTASLQNATHIYSTAGIYNVTLTAYNNYGNNTTTRTSYISVLQPPVAAFNGTPTLGNRQVNVQFNDLSTGEGITNWNWDFGDGNTSTSRNPLHLYTNLEAIPKTYNVTLTINNTFEVNATTQTRYITVYPPLTAGFTATPTTGQAPLVVDFTDTSTGYDIIGWSWDFGDGSPMASLRNVSHTYTTAGTYTATLTVTNPAGQSAPATRTITVTAPVTTPTPAGAAIIGTIYNDQNGDGAANTGDPKLAGWTINLLQNDVVIATKTSDASGAYGFYGLQNGKKYFVVEVLPVGWQGTNPAGGRSAEIHITGNDQIMANFWNYYKPVTTGGVFNLRTGKPGSLQAGGYLQFRDTVSWSNTGVTIDGTFHHVNQGDTVRLYVESSGSANLQASNPGIWGFTVQDVTLSINGVAIQRGAVTGISIHGYDSLQSTLTVIVPSLYRQTTFTVNSVPIISGQSDSRIINLYNVTFTPAGYINLKVDPNLSDIYIDASAGSYQLLP